MASRARSTSYNPPSSLESDYGSDFTPEEEEILNELVRNAAFPSDTASFAASFTGNSATITSTKRSALIGDIFDSSEIVDDTIDDQDKLEEGVLRLSQKSKSSASGHAIEDPTTGTAAGSMDPPPSTPPIQRAYFPDECGGWGGGWDGERPTTDEEGDGGYAARAKAVLRSVEKPSAQESKGTHHTTDTDTTPEAKPKRPRIEGGQDITPTALRYKQQPHAQTTTIEPELNTRTPLQRFRQNPRKGLSVTDFASPAWCELQWEYTLTKFGRKIPTAVMLRGTKVHKVLEEQVHRTVRVNVATRVDQFALRIWNIVLGLRTLRETGLTRELEVWGVLDGQVVTGIIDELIFKPEEIEEEDGKLPAGDGNINSLRRKSSRAHLTRETPKNLLYLSDVKTRSAAGIPKDADSRGALYQLMLYKSLLSDLATDKIPVEMILTRFGLDGDATFSSLFLESISGLDESSEDNESYDGGFGSTPQETSAQDALATLLEHNTLRKLWAFMVKELQITLPSGVDSISPKLRVEYRRSSNGEVMGEKIFRFNEDKLNAWITAQMQWWKGQREAKGVDIEEIDKCQKCEFSEECQWRVRLEQEWRAKRKQKVKIKMAKKGPGGKLVVTDGYY